MAVTYFQDTIFFTDTSLSAPGDGTVLQVASNNVRNFHQNVSSEKPLIALSYTFCDLSRSRYQLIPHAVHYQQFLDGLSEVYLCHNSLAISKL